MLYYNNNIHADNELGKMFVLGYKYNEILRGYSFSHYHLKEVVTDHQSTTY